MPAREQYAAIAAPALPLLGIAIVPTPSSLAIDTASASPRALNEPVGRRPSSLTRISPPLASRPAMRGSGISGVITSPSETTFSGRRTGSSSR